MKLYLIRHGITKGNQEKRYIGGKTDEELIPEGIRILREIHPPKVQRIYASPMKRCIQTAEILYPRQKIHVLEEFRETDFGRFENKNYEELKEDREYMLWLNSGGTMDFPSGESRDGVKIRVLAGVSRVVKELKNLNLHTAALVIHGGTIMHIMEAYGPGDGNFYDFQIKNGEWISLDIG